MKPSAIVLIGVAALITAGAFKTITSPMEQAANKKIVDQQKQLAIGCTPLYIPLEADDIPVLKGWGSYRWKVTTNNDSALFFFNQGINMYYAFHIIEARASFDKAARLDPTFAMAWYGKALAFGPNINDFGYQQPSEAYPSAQQANLLKNNSSPAEQALIEAMMVRYSNDSTQSQDELNVKYKEAMARVYEAFPQNENVSALYADALMLLHPWDLYEHNFQPKPWTPEIVTVLRHTLQLNPRHPGANHYLIHAVEASRKPGDALQSADILSTAMPGVSHLTHMPSHIYIRTGNYEKGITLNQQAVNGYQQYAAAFPLAQQNIALYSLHNIHMEMNCAQMAGSYSKAASAALVLQQSIPAEYLQMEGPVGHYIQYMYQSHILNLVRFGKWQDILLQPSKNDYSYSGILQHFARGMAYARTGNIPQAKAEISAMQQGMADTTLKVPMTPFNSAYNGASVALHLLQGAISEGQNNYAAAIAHYRDAVVTEDELIYNEPRDWLIPTRQYLGNALLHAKRFNEASQIFSEDLVINPNNGWALNGLLQSYKELKKTSFVADVQKRLTTAWKLRDMPIASAVF